MKFLWNLFSKPVTSLTEEQKHIIEDYAAGDIRLQSDAEKAVNGYRGNPCLHSTFMYNIMNQGDRTERANMRIELIDLSNKRR